MNRAIAVFGLVGLLSAGLVAASDNPPAPAATAATAAAEPAGLCAAPAPAAPETPEFLWRVGEDECSTYCPDGSQVSCTGPWGYCDIYVSCSPPWYQCAARCLNITSYCAGYGPSNCGC